MVVKSDGSIWFTDPVFGILGYYEGEKAEPELPPAVYRIDGQTGEASIVADDVDGPNGLAFSPDESILYVVASRAQPNRLIVRYDVVGGTQAEQEPRVFIDAGPGTPDGFRVDIHGNLWCGWGMGDAELDGVRMFNTAGAPIGHIALAGTLRQSVLRRTLAQPAVHGREPQPVCAVCEHAGCAGRLARCHADWNRRFPDIASGLKALPRLMWRQRLPSRAREQCDGYDA